MTNPDWDMPSEMTAIPKKLKMGGYATHSESAKASASLEKGVLVHAEFPF